MAVPFTRPPAPQGGWAESYFQLTQNGTNVRTEVAAGLTTFMTMAYILFVNPSILSAAGMDPGGTFIATALACAAATLLMGFYGRLPFALAPGMGMNAFFAFTAVAQMGFTYQAALAAVFIDGAIFLVLSLLPIRERIIREVPANIKLATGAAIGLFIAFIGLRNAGIVVANDATLVSLGPITHPATLLALGGLLLMGVLIARRVRGALIYGILAVALVGLFVPALDGKGVVTGLPAAGLGGLVAWPDFGAWAQHNLFAFAGGFGDLFKNGIVQGVIVLVFTFTFVDMFDTAGTFMGLASRLGWIDRSGSFPGAGRGLVVDSLGTMFGAILGTSTVTTYIESAAGVSEGGRTGLTSVITGALFVLALVLAPLAGLISAVATAPALILVGVLMAEPLLKLDLSDMTEAIPAFLTVVMMPLTYSIANGLIFGILSYTLLKLLTGRFREIGTTTWILTLLFVLNFII